MENRQQADWMPGEVEVDVDVDVEMDVDREGSPRELPLPLRSQTVPPHPLGGVSGPHSFEGFSITG